MSKASSGTPILDGFYKEIVEQIEAYNKALTKNDFSAMARAEAALKEAESSFAEKKAEQVFTLCRETEFPDGVSDEAAKVPYVLKRAIEIHSYDVVSHRALREEGKVIGLEIVEDKRKQIDLVKLCKFCGFDTNWQYKVEKFGQLLCLRAANELKMTRSQIKKICNSYYMNKLAQQEDLGETPDSNTQICQQLQKVCDSIFFSDNGKGKNSYRVNNHDVAYLLMCYSKRSNKKMLSVSVAKASYVHSLVLDVMHRLVTGKQYDLDYKTAKAKSESEKESKPVKGSEPETETVVVAKEATPVLIDDELPTVEELLG